jgi:hypothetical protein
LALIGLMEEERRSVTYTRLLLNFKREDSNWIEFAVSHPDSEAASSLISLRTEFASISLRRVRLTAFD